MKKRRFLSLLTAAVMAIMLLPSTIITASAEEAAPTGGGFVRDLSALDESVKGTIQTVPTKNQVMYVTFDTAPGSNDYLWFDVVSPLGDVYGVQAKGDGTSTSFAWSYLDKTTVKTWPKYLGMEVPTGAQSGKYKIDVFKSSTAINARPSSDTATKVTSSKIEITVGRKGDVRLIGANFRAHPETSSIFNIDEGQSENYKNLLWVEFSNKIDHTAEFDETTRTYTLDGVCYQLEIARPAHGPANDRHDPTSIVPKNGIVGNVSAWLTDNPNDGSAKHRYHGWHIGKGDDDLFDKDESSEYQTGEYIIRLWQLDPTDEEKQTATNNGKVLECEDKMVVSSYTINIVEVTYKLSDTDTKAGYTLKCPIEQTAKPTITELAKVGDWISIIDPSVECGTLSAKSVLNWNNVATQSSVNNQIPAAGNIDNKVTLEAVLEEPKSYTYEFRSVDDKTKIPADSSKTVSFNELAGSADNPKTIEYGDTTPLTLKLVNTGNQRSYIIVDSDNNIFNAERINQNNDDKAKEMYSDGGLEALKSTFWYIPSQEQVKEHQQWKNYALVEITPSSRLGVGTHTGTIESMNYTEGRLFKSFRLKIEIVPATPTADMAISAGSGLAGVSLSNVSLNGTFKNPHNGAAVAGELEWETPNEPIKDGTNSYKWKFTPEDKTNYKEITGEVSVTAESAAMEPLADAITHHEDGTFDMGFVKTFDGGSLKDIKSLKVKLEGTNNNLTINYPFNKIGLPTIDTGTVKLGVRITSIPDDYTNGVTVEFSSDEPTKANTVSVD